MIFHPGQNAKSGKTARDIKNTEKSKQRKKDLGKITTQLVTFMMALFNYDHKNPSVFVFFPLGLQN